MAQFMTQNRLHLRIVQCVQKPARDGDFRRLFLHPRRIGIQRLRLDDLQCGHGDPARNAQVFQNIIDLRHLLARHGLGTGRGVDDPLVEPESDCDPQPRRHRRPRHRDPENIDRIPYDFTERAIAIHERVIAPPPGARLRVMRCNRAPRAVCPGPCALPLEPL